MYRRTVWVREGVRRYGESDKIFPEWDKIKIEEY